LVELIESHAFRTAIYGAASLACLSAGRKHTEAGGRWPRKLATPASFWLSLGAVLFILALTKLFELQHLMGGHLRDVARDTGFYDVRRFYQRLAIYFVVGICLITFMGGLWLWARRWFVLAVPLGVVVVLLGFVTIRAICRFLCGLIELARGEKKTLRPFEIFLTPCTALGAAFYASHGFCSF